MSAMAFNWSASSTLGALVAIGGMKASEEAAGSQQLDPALMVRMLRADEAAMMMQGRADRGDKTLLDALGPSVDALEANVMEPARSESLVWRGMIHARGRSSRAV